MYDLCPPERWLSSLSPCFIPACQKICAKHVLCYFTYNKSVKFITSDCSATQKPMFEVFVLELNFMVVFPHIHMETKHGLTKKRTNKQPFIGCLQTEIENNNSVILLNSKRSN